MLAAKYGQDLINHEKAVKNKSFEMEKKTRRFHFYFLVIYTEAKQLYQQKQGQLDGISSKAIDKRYYKWKLAA